MLSSGNDGKYLSGKFARDRTAALIDKSTFSADEQAYLEIPAERGGVADRPDGYKIDTQPIDPNTTKKTEAIDVRTLPKNGGST